METSRSIRPGDIYQNWLNGENECEGCERRDEDCITTPYFGFGDFPAEVVFLGEAPGGTGAGGNNYLDTDKRVWKNYREVVDDAGEAVPGKISDFALGLEGLNNSHYDQLVSFFDAIERELEDIDHPQSFYYTNVAKCSDIWERTEESRRDDLNDLGIQRCRDGYLLSELQGADPSVIILFSKGTEHITDTLKTLGVPDVPSYGSVTPYVFNFEYEPGSSPFNSYHSPLLDAHIIVSYHYKQGFTETTNQVDEGKVRAEDIGLSAAEYSSDATTPRPKYADGVATKVCELIGGS